MNKRIFLIADHGLALIYFLQSQFVATLLNAGVEVVLFTDDDAINSIKERFSQPGLFFEGIRADQCSSYAASIDPAIQRWLDLLRWVGGSKRINTAAMDGNYHLLTAGYFSSRQRYALPFLRMLIWSMRRSRPLRRVIVSAQNRYTTNIYGDLFEKYRPDWVIARTPGWRQDRYILREAAKRGIPNAAVLVGWDNSSSYNLSGAPVERIVCWSEIQKEELVLGSDWYPEDVFVGGIPSYDGYFKREWLIPRDEYFSLHSLDPKRKLLAYACSFETLHPNSPNMLTLIDLVNNDRFSEPCQLLIRFHPNHFRKDTRFEGEKNRIAEYTRGMQHIHLVEPVSLGAGLAHYSGEDMPEKASMMAWSDVFLTVYSTMVVETAIHDRPIVSMTINTPGGWNIKGVYSPPLTSIGDWPTHKRFRESGAGRVAETAEQVREFVDYYLKNPSADSEERRRFVQDECTFTDGSAGRRTGEYILSLLETKK